MQDPTQDEIAARAWDQMRNCDMVKSQRLQVITEMQQAYYTQKFQPNINGRSNLPLPYFAYYIDELKARLDEPPIAKFHAKKDSQLLVARKVQSAAEIDRSPARGDWNRQDRMEKTMAIFSGIGVHDYFADEMSMSDDGKVQYASHYETIDFADFYFEPTGGSDLEQHAFVGKGNIFRSKEYLEEMGDLGVYDKKQVEKLFTRGRGEEYKNTRKAYLDRWAKFSGMGTSYNVNNYIGGEWFPLAQFQVQWGLKRWFIVFDMVTGEWVRCQPLKEVYKSGLYSMTMWQTHEDPNTVMSKSPAEDMWPIAEFLRGQANYLVDANTKHLWGQRIVDLNFVPNPADLYWSKPDQIIEGVAFNGKPLGNGVYEFTSEDKTTATLPLMQYMEGLLAKVSGVTPEDKAGNEAERVGVLFGNLQKVSARLGVLNKSYNECFYRTMVRYIWGLKQYLSQSMMVKLIGEHGVEWDELKGAELQGPDDFDIEIVGSNIELEMSEARKKRQMDAYAMITKDPNLSKQLNPRVTVEDILRNAEIKENNITRVTDVQNYGSERIISHASMAIEQLLRHKKPKKYMGADISFLQYGYDFITSEDLDHGDFMAIQTYFRSHLQIVVRNMTIKAVGQLTAKGISLNQIKAPVPQVAPKLQAGRTPMGNPPVINGGAPLGGGAPGMPPAAPPTPPMPAAAPPALPQPAPVAAGAPAGAPPMM